MAAELAIAEAEQIAGSITEVFIIQQFKDCYNLKENHELLNENVESMSLQLYDVCNRFQEERRVLPDPVEKCITKMVDAAKKAKELSVRIEERRSWCFDCWNLCYPKLSTECREWNTKLVDLTREYNSKIHAAADVQRVVTSAKAGPVLPLPVPVDERSDIKSAERQLQEWLTQSKPPYRVVGVCGMGGIGKTTLLKIIHNHFQKESSIFEIVIWVTVSQNFKVEGFYNSIAKELKLDEEIDSNRARTKVCKFLENKIFLLILDDLWQRIDFGEVGFSFGNHQGSRVLISSRNRDVIAEMGAKDSCWEMKLMSEEEAWEVFKSKAFTNGPAALDRNIKAIAREIAKKCQGLPLALNAVGAAMISNETEEDWSRALRHMGTAGQDFQVDIRKQLRYSYDVLDEELKICFLYCAAFPEGAEIDADRLVEIWIAEGVLTCRQTPDLMDEGRDILKRLARRCLIDSYDVPIVSIGPFPSWCINLLFSKDDVQRNIKVHDVLRDMAIHLGKSEKQCLFATNRHLTDFPGQKQVSNCKRISLGHNDIQHLPNKLMECSNLVSLLLPSNQKLSHVPEQFLRSVTSLRVLDLSKTDITGLPESVGELRLLEFLDLSHCQKLIELPESVGNLSALQFFNLYDCDKLESLPSTIRGLKKLKHLNLDGCLSMEVNSDDIGQLTSLNRLVLPTDSYQSYKRGNVVRAVDIKNLTKLRMLNAVVGVDVGVVTLDTWKEIKELKLSLVRDPESLTTCGIQRAVRIENIESVEILYLGTYKRASLPVCEFQNLKVLQLFRCKLVRELPIHSFPKLEVLHLFHLKKFSSLSGTSNEWREGSMSQLQKLRIFCCPVLMQLPLRMRLSSLQVLDIRKCDGLKELDIGNGDFPMLKEWSLGSLSGLQSITSSNGVWNEEAISKLERVVIYHCPLISRISKKLIQLFKSNKMASYSDVLEQGDNIDNDEDESIAIKFLPNEFLPNDYFDEFSGILDMEYYEECDFDAVFDTKDLEEYDEGYAENIRHGLSDDEEYHEQYIENEEIGHEFWPHEEKYSE